MPRPSLVKPPTDRLRLDYRTMDLNPSTITEALKAVKYPGYSRDIVSFGLVKNVAANQGAVSLLLALTTPNAEIAAQLKAECERVLKSIPGISHTHIEIKLPAGPAPSAGTAQAAAGPNPWSNQSRVAGIKRIIAVASGKGGVGKSTCSVNLACALSQLGLKVGLLDCDIYGPSIPLMMGVKERPTVNDEEKLVPVSNHGVKLMSMGFLLDGDAPVIWRGPMIVKTIQQFIFSVAWGELDYLLVDLPPGTGDAQLTLCQTVPLDGGVVITTPQEASLGVVRKGIAMFEKVNVPILGLVENMSYFVTPNNERLEIFGHGGGKTEAERMHLPFLGEIPLYTAIRIGGDQGTPVTVSAPQDAPAQAFATIAKAIHARFAE
jgi:ATP-binding protein involved in chromosome partitioning